MRSCTHKVTDPNTPFVRNCMRNGTVEREGFFYCNQHDPEKVKKRREAKRKLQEAQDERDRSLIEEAHRLLKRAGVKGNIFYSQIRGVYKDSVVISFDELHKIITRLERL